MARMFIVFVMVIFALLAVPAEASSPRDGWRNEVPPIVVTSLDPSNPPIQVGEVVEVVRSDDVSVTLRHHYKYGAGFSARTYQIPSLYVSLHFKLPGGVASSFEKAEAGDRGTIMSWSEVSVDADKYFVSIEEIRPWTQAEEFVVTEMMNFGREAQAGGFALLHMGFDCGAQWWVDGVEPIRGPYGYTIMVNSAGSKVTGYTTPELSCWRSDYEGSFLPNGQPGMVLYEATLFPGQALVGFGGPQDIAATASPKTFCEWTRDMLPLYQTQSEVPAGVRAFCENLFSVADIGAHATMARIGYKEEWSRGFEPRRWSVFSPEWYLNEVTEQEVPVSSWETVEAVDIDDGLGYYVINTIGGLRLEPTSHLVNGPRYSSIYLRSGMPVIFIPRNELSAPFDWGTAKVFRVVENADGSYVLQKAVVR